MSHALISRSPDLRRLRDEGYDIVVRAGHLVVRDVPYVDANAQVQRGVLVTNLTLANDVTTEPNTHVMLFAGAYPCHKDGSEIDQIRNSSHPGKALAEGVTVDHRFSAKPEGGRYRDHYEKVVTYVRILGGPAAAIQPDATARTYPVVSSEDEEAVFRYVDTAASRAGITGPSEKLKLARIGIVGLGGTGSYVLDLVAKTPVEEIWLIDGDVFRQHNAFRAPGAASGDDLAKGGFKVHHFKNIYDKMRRGITAYPEYISSSSLHLISGMDFVFLCFDGGLEKQVVVEKLIRDGIPFVDVGMGLELTDDSVTGLLRVTTGTPTCHRHVGGGGHIPFAASDDDDLYSTNIQVADLNALNAALAVIKFKKLFGFYLDLEREHHSVYMLNGNAMTNEAPA